MPQFLTPAWVDALNDALADVPAATSGESFAVAHEVRGGPDGDTVLVFRVADGRTTVSLNHEVPAQADVVLREDYATAVAIAKGELTAQQAAAAGRLRFAGEVHKLPREAAALSALGPAFAQVQTATTY